jgi:Domain of unknown function (DUF397)
MTTALSLPGVAWRKSSYSGENGGNCVEIGEGIANVTPVRDSKDPHGPALVFANDAWTAFVSAVRTDEFPGLRF